MRQLTLQIVERLHRTIETPDKTVATSAVVLAVVPATNSVPLSGFTQRLVASFKAQGSTLLVTKELLFQRLAPNRPQGTIELVSNSRIIGWLNEQEENYDFVVYEAEDISSAWTGRCLRQADCVLLVAPAESADELDKTEDELSRNHVWETRARKELVLLRQHSMVEPGVTARWLKALKVTRHHHVYLESKTDLARLVRMVTGRAVGLVLSGGGCRGFAHIGVIRAMKEASVPIDIIGGSSMGAIMAALYAMSQDPDAMLKATRQGLIEAGSLHDYVFPLVSLVGSMRWVKVLAQAYGDIAIEDLTIKYFCTTTNLSKATVSIHETGLLRKWVAASARVPGYAPPEFHDSDLHVDGGVLNNLPVDVMRSMTPGPIVAVDVSVNADLSEPFKDWALQEQLIRRVNDHVVYLPSPWRFFWERINPFAHKRAIPLIHDILVRTAGLSSVISESTFQKDADLCLLPPLGAYRLFDYEKIEEIVAAGYEYARVEIEKWKMGSKQEAGGS